MSAEDVINGSRYALHSFFFLLSIYLLLCKNIYTCILKVCILTYCFRKMIVSYTLIASCLLAASLSAPVQTPDYAPKNSVKIVLDCAAYLCTNNLTLADLNNATQPILPKAAYNVTAPV